MDNYVVSIASLRIHSQEDAFVATLLITQGCGSNAPTLFSKDVNMGVWEWMTVEVTGVPFNRTVWERGDDLCVKLTGTYTVLNFFSMFVGLTFVPNKGVPELLTPALSPDAVTQHIAAGSYDGVNTTWGMNGELSSSAQTYAGVITCTEYGKLRFSLEAGKPGFVTIIDHTGAEKAFSFSEDYVGNLVWMDVPCVKGKQIFVVSEQASHFSWAFWDVIPTAVPSTAVPTVAPTFVPPTAVPTAVPTVAPTAAPVLPCEEPVLITEFTDSSEFVSNAPLTLGGDGFIMEADVRVDGANDMGRVFEFSNGMTKNGVILAIDSKGQWEYHVWQGEQHIIFVDPVPGPCCGVFMHVVLVVTATSHDTGFAQLFFDGIERVSASGPLPVLDTRTDNHIYTSTFPIDKPLNGVVANFSFSTCRPQTQAPPTVSPTVALPTATPTAGPTVSPTVAPPTAVPTAVPTVAPTAAPVLPCEEPVLITEFTDSSEFVSNVPLTLGGDGFIMEADVRVDGANDMGRVFEFSNGMTKNGVILAIDSKGQWEYHVWQGEQHIIFVDPVPGPCCGVFMHVVLVVTATSHDTGFAQLFFDGIERVSASGPLPVLDTRTDNHIYTSTFPIDTGTTNSFPNSCSTNSCANCCANSFPNSCPANN